MQKKTISEISQIYDLELEKAIRTISKEKAKNVLLQFPEGMKPYAQAIADEIEEKAKCNCIIWMSTCFGACDIPIEAERIGIDLTIQFGHSDWRYKDKDIKVLK